MFRHQKIRLFAFALFSISFCASHVFSQHCSGIIESYLESIAIKRNDGDISFHIEYRKSGNPIKESYQAYILAYSDSDAEKIAAMTPQEAIEKQLVTILNTHRADQQLNGSYKIQWKTDTQALVASLLKDSRLKYDQSFNNGGYKMFQDRIRVAIFIPFLEDEKYSVIEGLPENKHECNYLDHSALFYDTLPQIFTVHFGADQGYRLPKDKFAIHFNGREPRQNRKKDHE